MAFGLSSLKSILKSDLANGARGSVLGVDIGASSIKIVQLKNDHDVPTLETYGELQLGPYEGVDIGRATQLPQVKLVEALVDILRESGATGKQAAFSFSYNASFTNTVSLPTTDSTKIASMVPVEARKYVPISLSKVTLDWVELGVDDEKKETRILLSATYNEAIAKYESIMQGAQLTIATSEIELFSNVRSVVKPSDTSVVVLDIGASSTRLYVVENGFATKTHSVQMSGVELNRALEKELKTTFIHAEEIKRTYGLHGSKDDPRIQKALAQSLERGLREIHTVLTRYEEEEGRKMGKIILTGGGSLLLGLDTYLHDMFSRPVEYANPFAKVAYPAFLEDTLGVAGPSFSVAIGVALKALQTKNA